MKTQFAIENPDSVLMTLKITMTGGEWKRLQAQLDSAYPSWKLSSAISEMVRQASTQFGETKEIDL